MTKRIAIKTVLYITCACLMLSMCAVCIYTGAGAVSYSGRGSKSDPYLIYNAEQLNGIRDNLSAHYKLMNTVDLSGISNFKPIGSIKTPFKGSLSCDLGSGGKPLYAIKNLKMKVSPKGATKAEGFTGFKKDGSSGWEAGLFGCADGAAFTNILVLDANVTSTVEGLYMMNGDYSVNPGTDDMAAGILVAIGKNITVNGCGVSGKVTSSSNHVGGMLGIIHNSSVSKSWSLAAVTSTGSWGSGGVVGSAKGTVTISESFYNGTFSGGKTHAGAFGGSVYGDNIRIKDCWSAGTVKSDTSGCFIGTKNHTDDNSLENVDIASQCYTVSKIAGRTQKPSFPLNRLKNANYAAKEAGVMESKFAAATQDEINAAFKSFSAWTVKSGSYPQLKNTAAVKASDYKPQSNSGQQPNATTAGGHSGNTQATNPQSTGAQSSKDQQNPQNTGDTEEPQDTGTNDSTDAPEETNAAAETGQTQGEQDGDADSNGDLRVMSRRAETLLVIILAILAAAALAGSAATIIVMIRKRPGSR